jgi:hypothetical protein
MSAAATAANASERRSEPMANYAEAARRHVARLSARLADRSAPYSN